MEATKLSHAEIWRLYREYKALLPPKLRGSSLTEVNSILNFSTPTQGFFSEANFRFFEKKKFISQVTQIDIDNINSAVTEILHLVQPEIGSSGLSSESSLNQVVGIEKATNIVQGLIFVYSASGLNWLSAVELQKRIFQNGFTYEHLQPAFVEVVSHKILNLLESGIGGHNT